MWGWIELESHFSQVGYARNTKSHNLSRCVFGIHIHISEKIVVSNCKVDRCCIGFGETAHYKWCLTENSIHYGTPNEWRQMKMFPKCFWAADTRGRGETLFFTNSNTSNNNVFLSDELKTGPSQCLSYLGCPTGGTVLWAQLSKLLIRQK